MEEKQASVIHKMKYDLDLKGGICEGLLTFRDGIVEASENGSSIFVLSVTGADRFTLTANIGCGYIEYEKDGSPDILCRFTMSYFTDAGEFCKILNYYIQSGLVADVAAAESRECPKCGKRLAENTNVCFFCVDKLRIYRKTFKLLAKYKKPLIIITILTAVSNLMYIVTPILNRILIDDYLRPKRGTVNDIAIICASMLLLRAAGDLMFMFSSRISNKASGSIADFLRRELYSKVHQLSMSSMSKKTAGDMLKRITGDTQKIRDFIADQGRWAFEKLCMFVVIAVILFVTNPLLALMVFIPVPVVMIMLNHYWQIIYRRYHRQWRIHSHSNAILHDIIKGIRVVKTFGNEDREIAKFDRACKALADVSADNEKFWTKVFSVLGFMIGSSEFLVLYFGGRAVLGRELTIGELVQFTMYLVYIYEPLRWLTKIPRWIADLTTSLVKMFEILDEEPDLKDTVRSGEAEINGNIEFKNVIFGYKSYEPVLKDVSFEIKPGEMIGVVGHSGVGKSTLINLVMRLYDINDGKITIGGHDIKNIPLKTLHESIGVVFQETFLFAGTIYENISYAKPEAGYDEVIAASVIANAHEFVIKLPDAYNTVIGENGYSLSGGERQRIAIARAVLRNPSILILDEATATLDVETESRIQDALAKLTKGRTTIAIAHRLSTLRNADRLIVLDKGNLAETGTHAELIKKKGVYYNLVVAQKQTMKQKDDSASV